MYKVYWTDRGCLDAKEFPSDEMGAALHLTQTLHQRQHDGEDIHFITMSSETPHSVGRRGYDVTGPDYDWKKRRI
jgi:hypothetical protein